MKTYKIESKWSEFGQYLKDDFGSNYADEVGFLHDGKELIYMRTSNDTIKQILEGRHKVTECELPVSDDRLDHITGNKYFFDDYLNSIR